MMRDCYTKPNLPFEVHVFEGSQKLTEADYKEDAFGRKYRNVSVIGWAGELDEYVADQSFFSNVFKKIVNKLITNKVYSRSLSL